MAEFDMGIGMPPSSPKKKTAKKKKKKKGFFKQMYEGLFPVKGDDKGEIIRKIIFLLSLIILVISGVIVIRFYLIGENAGEYNQRLNDELLLNANITQEQIDNLPENAINTKLAAYYEKNNDTIGYISIPYTNINYVVVQDKTGKAEGNDYYLYHDFEGNRKEAGWIFVDFRNEIKPNVPRANTVIYGHNLYTKHMFQALENYTELDFLKKSPTFTFDTLYEKAQYKIFGVMITNTLEEHGEVFDYHNYLNFDNEQEFNYYVTQILDRSMFTTGVDLQYGDELVTLSTCDFKSYNLKDLRLVIFGRKLREGESPYVDTENITNNEGYRLIDRLYKDNPKKYGEKWEGRKWDTSLVKNFDKYTY
ncbi:MAG: class B sortase [Clostridiales bacterium]|nr:class B sortase [Clostridiales bacterium]